MDQLLQFAGRLHPMILHAPIGLAIGLVLIEVLAIARRRPLSPDVRWTLVWAAALAAVASAASGLLLREEGYSSETAELHKWLGIATAVVMLSAAIFHQAKKTRAYGATLFLAAALLVPTGHFGASVTHGENFLTEPFDPPTTLTTRITTVGADDNAPGNAAGANTVFASTIQPILNTSCIGCHGDNRKKGGLGLHSGEALLAGGDNGPAIVPGKAADSDLVRRLRLPLDDDDHMPPESKPQPTPDQIKAIEDWINAGASMTDLAAPNSAAGSAASPAAAPAAAVPVANAEPSQADPKSLEAVRTALVHVEPVARGSALLVVNASAVAPSIDDDACTTLLAPLKDQIADLTLARTAITDATLKLISTMPRLRRLDIAGTHVTDAGVESLAKHKKLEELVLSQTGVTAKVATTLASLTSLREVFLWKTAITEDEVRTLRTDLKKVEIDMGDAPLAEALEVEKDLKFTTPAPEAKATASADALKPINTECPVTGKALDPEYAIVFKGKVVGFCCRHCLGQFLEEPEKFQAKLKLP